MNIIILSPDDGEALVELYQQLSDDVIDREKMKENLCWITSKSIYRFEPKL
jgi:hypothetical protein